MNIRTTGYIAWLILCAMAGIIPQIANWRSAALALALGAALAITNLRAAARNSPMRRVLVSYAPRWRPGVPDVVALIAFAVTIVPDIYAAVHGEARSVFRALIFGNVLLMWLRHRSGREPGNEAATVARA